MLFLRWVFKGEVCRLCGVNDDLTPYIFSSVRMQVRATPYIFCSRENKAAPMLGKCVAHSSWLAGPRSGCARCMAPEQTPRRAFGPPAISGFHFCVIGLRFWEFFFEKPVKKWAQFWGPKMGTVLGTKNGHAFGNQKWAHFWEPKMGTVLVKKCGHTFGPTPPLKFIS